MWDYQPIALLFLFALFHRIFDWIKGNKPKEYLSMFAVILPFVALSMSKYKLPHYIFPLLPFAVLHAVSWVETNPDKQLRKTALIIQKGIVALYPVIAVLAFFLFFTPSNPWLLLAALTWVGCTDGGSGPPKTGASAPSGSASAPLARPDRIRPDRIRRAKDPRCLLLLRSAFASERSASQCVPSRYRA